MKFRNLILFFAFLPFLSCHKYCNAVALSGFTITYTDSLTDSSATVITYKKGSNFSQVIDSTNEKVSIEMPGYAFYGCDFSNTNIDHKLILHPSGIVHTVTNIRYGHEKERGGDLKSNYLLCSYGYTLDGVIVNKGTTWRSGNVAGTTNISIILN